ncbi:von Willebrand factor A domain-containing protein 7 [Merluccius polli]|uniref:von Willebrand factor A domain-containing protein 7 n=1 Tax=Merluccius polli TaxID=89951 RepID=A0AA47M788_MERPO|nr:von Willebrand factor A domain-containing protein 7 [Merluccius polli]
MRSSECWSLLSLVLLTGAAAFKINRGPSMDHSEITQMAILDVAVRTCRSLAEAEGRDFVFPRLPLTVTHVIAACDAVESTKSFQKAIKSIQRKNKRVDIRRLFNAAYHFDDETFEGGRKIITDGLAIIKASNKLDNFKAAREKLGEITHPLQDFYSHSNWIELGKEIPNNNLITVGTKIGNIDLARPTCQNCVGNDCTNNILEDIIRDQILTTGYFDALLSSKPAGKCSHGGRFDQTSDDEPVGGINKDTLTANHGHLHNAAAQLAITATIQLLDDIRGAAGDTDFLRMLGISKGSNKALCFVIDTTGSMADDILAVKAVTASIIDTKAGTRDEPSLYILVPFNDPDFGPLRRTTDPNVFKTWLSALTANGGGDFPELSLSGLQLALTGAPPGSEMFLFTDATAKDIYLKDTVIALIEQTKTVVNFMLTGSFIFSFRSLLDNNGNNIPRTGRMSSPESQLYSELAYYSGGQAIEVSKDELSEATSIITESSAASLVTLLQAVRSPGKDESFSFSVDESVRNLTIYITGNVLNFTLTSPSGVSQSTNSPNESLATVKVVGNFRTLQINPTVGIWEIMLLSTNPYTIKVIGQSGIDFLFDFVQFFQGASEGFDVLENRPGAGGNGTLLLTLTGSDSGTVTDVSLVEASGSGEVNGRMETLGGGEFLAHFDTIPSVEFVVRVKGNTDSRSKASTNDFQRQSNTQLKASTLAITTTFDSSILEPGSSFSVPFTVTTNGTGGNFTIVATNDQGFASMVVSPVELADGGSANGTVTLTAPLNTPTGTAVTLTIQAESPGSTDTNYVVLVFSIVARVTDNSRPLCQVISLTANCTSICSQSTWVVTANLTDANSTGIERISLQQGNGTLNTSTVLGPDGENVTLVMYTASCCSPDFELVAVDGAGNVGNCFQTIREPVSATVGPPVTNATTSSSTTNTTMSSSATASPQMLSCYYFWQTMFAMLGLMVTAPC